MTTTTTTIITTAAMWVLRGRLLMRFINKYSSVHARCPFKSSFFSVLFFRFYSFFRNLLFFRLHTRQTICRISCTREIHRGTELDFNQNKHFVCSFVHTQCKWFKFPSIFTKFVSCQFFNRMFCFFLLLMCLFFFFFQLLNSHRCFRPIFLKCGIFCVVYSKQGIYDVFLFSKYFITTN